MTPGRVIAVILAAGGSTRMGRSKALLPWRGATMLRHVAREALSSRVSRVAVVVGCQAAAARRAVDGLEVRVVENEGWDAGMGTSLAAGAAAVASETEPPDALVVLLADQPLVSAATIDRLIAEWEATGKPLVASRHGAALGAPALFASRFFDALRSLSGDRGARDVLLANAGLAAVLDLPEARVDVDTPEDFERLSRAD